MISRLEHPLSPCGRCVLPSRYSRGWRVRDGGGRLKAGVRDLTESAPQVSNRQGDCKGMIVAW